MKNFVFNEMFEFSTFRGNVVNFFVVLILYFLVSFSFVFAYTGETTTSNSEMNSIGYPFPDASHSGTASIGQKIITAGAGTLVIDLVYMMKGGSPVDNTTISIFADSGGSPTGSALDTISFSSDSLATSCTGVDASALSISVTASTAYWVVLSRTGSFSTAGPETCGHLTSNSGLDHKWQNEAGTWGASKTQTQRIAYTVTEPSTTFNLAVTKSGVGTGTITTSPTGISCGATCDFDFDENTEVTITATADTGSVFTTWDNVCGTDNPCVITMNDDYIIDAEFATTSEEIIPPTTGTTTAMTYHDQMLIWGVVIFFLSFSSIALTFNTLYK